MNTASPTPETNSVHATEEIEGIHAETGEVSHEETGILGTFGIQPGLFVAQLINFSIVVFVLTKWVFKPLLKTMDERKKTIDDGLKRSEESEKTLVEAQKTKEEIVHGAHAEAQEIVNDARDRGEMEKQKRIEASKMIIARQLEESKQQAMSEALAERQSVRSASANLIAEALEKVAPGAIDEKKQHSLIAKALEDLESHV